MMMEMDELFEVLNPDLLIDNDQIKAEFKVATRKALEKMEPEFEFYGYTVEVGAAIDVVNQIESTRTYH